MLVFLKDGGSLLGTEERNLDRLFQVIRSRPEAVSTNNDQRKKNLDDHLRAKLALKNAALMKGFSFGLNNAALIKGRFSFGVRNLN